MKFKEIKELVGRGDGISIMLSSTGDVYDNYINIDHVPQDFDEMEIIGFSSVDCMHVDHIDCPIKGTEFYLNDEGEDEKCKNHMLDVNISDIKKMAHWIL